jgi:hypothetical protein
MEKEKGKMKKKAKIIREFGVMEARVIFELFPLLESSLLVSRFDS